MSRKASNGAIQAFAESYRRIHGRWPTTLLRAAPWSTPDEPEMVAQRLPIKTLSRNRLQRLYSGGPVR